jgi:hypothetical protein
MYNNLLFQIVLSLFIIYFIHSIWDYAKNRYTVHRNKDLVSIQTQKYKEVIENMQHTFAKTDETIDASDIALMNDELSQLIQTVQ